MKDEGKEKSVDVFPSERNDFMLLMATDLFYHYGAQQTKE